jgi:cbb3-type cytochrome oxidase maturation protein
MSILFVLIPISMLLAIGALAACIWAIKHGQYNDVLAPAYDIIVDDILERGSNKKSFNESNEYKGET